MGRRHIDIDELWARYRAEHLSTDRDRLVLNYSPLVKFVASRVGAGLPQSVELNELISTGMFGLLDAIEKFEPERGFKFETYAMARIKGAILDHLRASDWVPRSVRTKARQIERAYARFESRFHRAPTTEELAEDLGLPIERVEEMMRQVANTGLVALDETVGGDRGESITLGDTVADRGAGPVEMFDDDELRHRLGGLINQLPEREKLVLALYYYAGMTLADIGDVLGVTESRICQVHTKAVLHLKARLEAVERD
ncbi:MAG: FliA/WhiG family RNA polymerase sigma factor, partial [Actinomycetota bacterium]|nr:FliA/WhiG family RNA polymerase sigma factor [Actinomycetota bacterium]